jgi:hypothetical protein
VSNPEIVTWRARISLAWMALVCAVLGMAAPAVDAQDLVRGNYYWYAPEHETFSKTQFYSQPRFDTAQVRITRTQRFRLVSGGKGWFMLEFDVAGKAYIHMRLLRNLTYDPAATDAWYEFKRASVFAEEPSKIEARLKAAALPASTPQAIDSGVPSWKRYKDGWNLRGSRPSTTVPADPADPNAAAIGPRPADKKPRSKYPLLPPIGSEPAREENPAEGPPGEPGAPAERAP